MQKKVLKFNYICVSWGLSETDLEANFLNFENLSFENVTFENVEMLNICLNSSYFKFTPLFF